MPFEETQLEEIEGYIQSYPENWFVDRKSAQYYRRTPECRRPGPRCSLIARDPTPALAPDDSCVWDGTQTNPHEIQVHRFATKAVAAPPVQLGHRWDAQRTHFTLAFGNEHTAHTRLECAACFKLTHQGVEVIKEIGLEHLN